MTQLHKLIRFITAVSIIACSVSVSAETKKSAKKSTKRNVSDTKSSKYSSDPFDVTVENLPPNYWGQDLELLYAKLDKIRTNTPVKDQFETSEQFKKRYEEYEKQPVLKNLNKDSTLAASLPADLIYNADTQDTVVEIHIGNFVSSKYYLLQKDQEYCTAGNRVLKSKSYSDYMSNTFGATVKVKHNRNEYIGLAINNPEVFGLDKSKGCGNVIFKIHKMEADTAKQLKNDLAVMTVFNIVDPYVKTNSEYSEATIDAPYEWSSRYKYVVSNIKEAWVYSLSTGKVFLKEKY